MEIPAPVTEVIELPTCSARERPSQRKVRWILGASLFLGVLGDGLLRTLTPGINVAIFCFVTCMVLIWGERRHQEPAPCRYLLIVLCLFGFCVAWRDASVLCVLNTMAIVIILLVLILRPTLLQLNSDSLYSLGTNVLLGSGQAMGAPLRLLCQDTDWTQFKHAPTQRSVHILRGLMISLPVLIVFTCLFSQADAVFSAKVEAMGHRLGDLVTDADQWILHTLYSLLFFVLATSILYPLVLGKKWRSVEVAHSFRCEVGEIELVMVMGSMLVLFLLFILIQFRYLFGGHDLVQTVAGLTYASYARKGFFALVATVLLLHALLMAGGCLFSRAEPHVQFLFRCLSLGHVFAVTFVFASAFYRLLLYVESYGLTRSRFYASMILLWLAIAFLLLTTRILFPQWRFFSGVYFQAILVMVLCLNVINPDGLIARVNITRSASNGNLDREYLEKLSTDAIPAILSHGSFLSPNNMSEVAEGIIAHRIPDHADWRNWNFSRARAQERLTLYRDTALHGVEEQ